MAYKKFGKGSELWLLFTDFWVMCQRLWIIEPTDEYWKEVKDETNAFVEKYKNYTIAFRLATALVDDLEHKDIYGGQDYGRFTNNKQ